VVKPISEEDYEEAESQFEGEEGYTDNSRRRSSKYGGYGEESQSMSASVRKSENPGALEQRLE
jgi:hypothetical protein